MKDNRTDILNNPLYRPEISAQNNPDIAILRFKHPSTWNINDFNVFFDAILPDQRYILGNGSTYNTILRALFKYLFTERVKRLEHLFRLKQGIYHTLYTLKSMLELDDLNMIQGGNIQAVIQKIDAQIVDNKRIAERISRHEIG